MEYNFKEIESKWQNVWYTQNTFAAKQDFSLPKYYCLVEFPYPSGQGPDCLESHRLRTCEYTY